MCSLNDSVWAKPCWQGLFAWKLILLLTGWRCVHQHRVFSSPVYPAWVHLSPVTRCTCVCEVD